MVETLRVAILAVSLRLLEGAEISAAQNYYDGDVWVEPERRYDIGAFLKRCDLPKHMHVLQSDRHPTVWLDYPSQSLRIVLESDEFPQVEMGTMPPMLDVMLRDHYDETFQHVRISFESYTLRG